MIVALYTIGSSTVYDVKKQKDQLQLFLAPSDSVQGLCKQHSLKVYKLVQLDKMLHKWFAAVGFKGNP